MELSPDLLLKAYMIGVFPMSEGRDDPSIFWVDPDNRGILPLERFHIPKSLAKTVRKDVFEVRVDTAFRETMLGCAATSERRRDTWINGPILDLYTRLFDMRCAHSVECWQDGDLVGGLYGVSIGGAFFGESMFTRVTDASKVALVHLVARMRAGGFTLLDTQFTTEHLERFGATLVPRESYLQKLADALERRGDWGALPYRCDGASVLQSMTQTS